MAHRPQDPTPAHYLPSRVGILADDLTGAADTALQYLAPDADVWVLPALGERVRLPAGASALAVNTESRNVPPSQAAQRVEAACRALHAAGCGRYYKKIDSTLRGNLAIEILQALSTLQLELAVVAPAFPQAGRITVGGYQLVDGVPVEASPYGRDPLAPVADSHLPSLLAAEGVGEVEHLGLKEVMAGPERVATAIVRAIAGRKRVLVADAARPEDLQAIARGMALVPFRLLPVGSAGLAKAMQPHHVLDVAPTASRGPVLIGVRPPVLVVAGSLNPVTARQVEVLARQARLVVLDVEGLLLAGEPAVDRVVMAIRPLLLAQQDVVLATGVGADPARRARDLGRDLAMGATQIGARVAAAVGDVVARLLDGLPPMPTDGRTQPEGTDARRLWTPLAGLVVAGGETATAVCRALGAPPLRVVDEPLPAIPMLRADLGALGPASPVRVGGSLRLVTKSGGFGAPDALVALVERLKRDDSPSVSEPTPIW
jgi:uncharacterized protein YgbK (DUF1537 family)